MAVAPTSSHTKTSADAGLNETALHTLSPGQCGIVLGVDASEQDALRLVAMGVCVGRRIQAVKSGDPMILRVLGTRIGLSRRLACTVRVEPCENPACRSDACS